VQVRVQLRGQLGRCLACGLRPNIPPINANLCLFVDVSMQVMSMYLSSARSDQDQVQWGGGGTKQAGGRKTAYWSAMRRSDS
jgi:hypothetical protein